MNDQTNALHSLPQDVSQNIWRIIGDNESPLEQETTSRLIEKMLRKYASRLSASAQGQAISDIRAWFDFYEETGQLREDARELVASVVIDGIKDILATQNGISNRETAFCAVGSIEPHLAMNLINRSWSQGELDTFIRYAFKTLEILRNKGVILNVDRIEQLGVSGARSHISTIQMGERLETYWRLKDYDWYLYPSIANMVELLMKLNRDHFYTMIEKIDHPIVHLRAARCYIHMDADANLRTPLQWLNRGSTDPMVALAIVHILDNVNRLDSDLRQDALREGGSVDIEDSALLDDMVERLSEFEPVNRAQWIVELLSYSASMLNASGRGEKPTRIKQLEELCCEQLKHLALQYWSDELAEIFRFGMSDSPRTPRILPLAQAAYDIRESRPARSAEVVRLILDTHERQIAESLKGDRGFYYNLRHWDHQDWVNGLAAALVLSDRELDLSDWVSEKCRELPMSAWDAEEDYARFLNTEKVAQFRFIVALHAIQMLGEVGGVVDSSRVLALAESFWSHCQFSQRHIGPFDGSEVSELAARVAVHLGRPSDGWLLDQAANSGVSPRALWGLIHQKMPGDAGRVELLDIYQLTFVAELRRIIAIRFGDVKGLGLTELYYLGELCLLLEASEQAEATAMAMDSFPVRLIGRPHKVMALKLLAFASSRRIPLAPESEDRIESLYSELWTSYSPDEEQTDRQYIDALLRSS